MIYDWIADVCRRAGHTDKEFIEAARFGASKLIERLCGDTPDDYEIKKYNHSHYATIWRSTSDERPMNESRIVLRNGATVCYAFYDKNGICYREGDSGPMALKDFWGYWCYKIELFGCEVNEMNKLI